MMHIKIGDVVSHIEITNFQTVTTLKITLEILEG